MLSNAMKACIIGTKASTKRTYFGKPFLNLECYSDESELILVLDPIYKLVINFYDRTIIWYKNTNEVMKDFNQELRLKCLGNLSFILSVI
jgi:hypothetical protein